MFEICITIMEPYRPEFRMPPMDDQWQALKLARSLHACYPGALIEIAHGGLRTVVSAPSGPLDVPCSVRSCMAAPGDPCKDDGHGHTLAGSLIGGGKKYHTTRVRRAKRGDSSSHDKRGL
jgi:hypothetical protein